MVARSGIFGLCLVFFGRVGSHPDSSAVMTLNDLSPTHFQEVGFCMFNRITGQMEWVYLFDRYELDAFDLARNGGSVITAQRRYPDGLMHLEAKLRRVNGRSS